MKRLKQVYKLTILFIMCCKNGLKHLATTFRSVKLAVNFCYIFDNKLIVK